MTQTPTKPTPTAMQEGMDCCRRCCAASAETFRLAQHEGIVGGAGRLITSREASLWCFSHTLVRRALQSCEVVLCVTRTSSPLA